MKNKILKASFIIALIISILSAFCICTDGYEIKASIVSLACLGYCVFIAFNSRGNWIFK